MDRGKRIRSKPVRKQRGGKSRTSRRTMAHGGTSHCGHPGQPPCPPDYNKRGTGGGNSQMRGGTKRGMGPRGECGIWGYDCCDTAGSSHVCCRLNQFAYPNQYQCLSNESNCTGQGGTSLNPQQCWSACEAGGTNSCLDVEYTFDNYCDDPSATNQGELCGIDCGGPAPRGGRTDCCEWNCCCEYTGPAGCTSSNACNYDPSATNNDGSCIYCGYNTGGGDYTNLPDCVNGQCQCTSGYFDCNGTCDGNWEEDQCDPDHFIPECNEYSGRECECDENSDCPPAGRGDRDSRGWYCCFDNCKSTQQSQTTCKCDTDYDDAFYQNGYWHQMAKKGMCKQSGGGGKLSRYKQIDEEDLLQQKGGRINSNRRNTVKKQRGGRGRTRPVRKQRGGRGRTRPVRKQRGGRGRTRFQQGGGGYVFASTGQPYNGQVVEAGGQWFTTTTGTIEGNSVRVVTSSEYNKGITS